MVEAKKMERKTLSVWNEIYDRRIFLACNALDGCVRARDGVNIECMHDILTHLAMFTDLLKQHSIDKL